MTDQPTTPLPLPGQASRPPAWEDSATRRAANRTLWMAVMLFVLALVAVGSCVAIVWLGRLGEAWGLPVLVATAGVAGGALAGGITLLILWGRTRGLLRAGPWVPGELTLAEGREAELVFGRSVGTVRMENSSGALGDPGDSLSVEVRSDGDRVIITVPPSRQFLRAAPVRDD
ncbi:MAG: hypothetical protein Q4G46_05350 [Propionibacteriaceae bacterium]|nr:hypothetical protein [Propionibacteriaceae bacterium]